MVDRLSVRALAFGWLTLVMVSALAYWFGGASSGHGLLTRDGPLEMDIDTLPTALYFSLVTVTSLGYGDVGPIGISRAISVAEAVMGLLIFSLVVAKFVSRRQEELLQEVHRVSFEGRLSRVQTTLHQVLLELQNLEALAAQPTSDPRHAQTRFDSTTLLFLGELRVVHELLYSPQQSPDEGSLVRIVSTLASALSELCEILASSSPASFSDPHNTAATIGRLASEFCAECVPAPHTQALQPWTQEIERAARTLREVRSERSV